MSVEEFSRVDATCAIFALMANRMCTCIFLCLKNFSGLSFNIHINGYNQLKHKLFESLIFLVYRVLRPKSLKIAVLRVTFLGYSIFVTLILTSNATLSSTVIVLILLSSVNLTNKTVSSVILPAKMGLLRNSRELQFGAYKLW